MLKPLKPIVVILLVVSTLAAVNHARRDSTLKSHDGTVCPESIQLYGEIYYGVDSTHVDSISLDSILFVMVTVNGDTTLTEQDFDSVEVCDGYSLYGNVEFNYYTIRCENGISFPSTKFVRWCVIRIPKMEIPSLTIRSS